MLLRPKEHRQLLIHHLLECYRRYALSLHLTLCFQYQIPICLCEQVQVGGCSGRFKIEMLFVGVGEEEVTEEGRVEEGLEDGVDVAGVADVVEACEV
jgi:hypothetical protein